MKHSTEHRSPSLVFVILFWLYVAVPLLWGVWSTVQKSLALFN